MVGAKGHSPCQGVPPFLMKKTLTIITSIGLLLCVAATSITPYIPPYPGDSTKFLRGDATWGVPSGSGGSGTAGTVISSGASIDNAVPRYVGTSGTNVAPTSVTITANTNVNAGSFTATSLITTGTRLDFTTDIQIWRNAVQYVDSDSSLWYWFKGTSLRADSYLSAGADLIFTSGNETTEKGRIDAATGDITTVGRVILSTATTPASASAAGTTGTITWDANFIYICIGPSTWRRAAHSTW